LHYRHEENLILAEEFADEDAADCKGWQGIDEGEEDRPMRRYSSLVYKIRKYHLLFDVSQRADEKEEP
jgi:hypothetical protein